MTTITIKPRNKKEFSALKTVLKAMNADFDCNEDADQYSPEFVSMIEQGEKEIKEGKGTKMTIEEMEKSWK